MRHERKELPLTVIAGISLDIRLTPLAQLAEGNGCFCHLKGFKMMSCSQTMQLWPGCGLCAWGCGLVTWVVGAAHPLASSPLAIALPRGIDKVLIRRRDEQTSNQGPGVGVCPRLHPADAIRGPAIEFTLDECPSRCQA